MSKTLRLVLALAVLPVLAASASVAALSTVLEGSLPERAAALPIVDANAYASKALQNLSNPSAVGDANLQHMALAAGTRTFEAEPTNSLAVSLMAFGLQSAEDPTTARKVYEDAILVAPRDRLANLWLLEDASQNGRIAYILDRYDVLLRTGGAASDVLFDVMGTALREDAILPHLERRLRRSPPWAEQFWIKVTPNEQAIANIGRLRLRLHRAGVENPAENDADILRRLVDAGHFDIAFALTRGLAGERSDLRAPVRHPDFAAPSLFAPIGWQTFAASGSGAEVDAAAGALVIYAEDPLQALVARQLLEVGPYRYAAQYRVREAEPLRSIRASLRTRCATGEGPPILDLAIDKARGSSPVVVPSACRYVWLEVWAGRDALSSGAVDDVVIDDIDLRVAE
jgi:hypothetical protein